MVWRARKKDGDLVDLEVIGSQLEHQGKAQILFFCREAEALPQPQVPPRRERDWGAPHREPEADDLQTGSLMNDFSGLPKPGWAPPEKSGSGEYAETFDREARKLIKRIEDAMVKVEKIRRSSGNRPSV
jgi:hypothetical protein